MALQQFACVFTVAAILLCKGCRSQQPACLSGGDAAVETYPWQAAITYGGNTFCEGSLISDQWVLTAARCSYYNYLSGAEVRLGISNQSDSKSNQTRRVEYYICHQDLNLQTHENDICIVKLSAPVNFTDYIQPICLAAENSTFYDGTPSRVSTFQYFYQPAIPQDVNVSIVGNNQCTCNLMSAYFSYYYSMFAPTENKLCASQNGLTVTYYGYMGSALVTKKDNIWVQSGILSDNFGYWQQVPTLFTSVSQYQKWISDRVSGTEPGFVTFTSPGNDSDLNYTCPTPAPTTPYTFFTDFFSFTTTTPETTTATTNHFRVFTDFFSSITPTPETTIDKSIWSSGGNLIPITHFISLSVLVLFLHVFVGSGGF